MTVRPTALIFAALPLVLAAAVTASGPAFWTVATSADFLAGRSEGVFVGLDGTVTNGPRLTSRLDSTPAQIWSLASGPTGVLWAGTGGDGRVLRLGDGQTEETVFDADEPNVFALAVSGPRVYAATGPDGKIVVIEADGTSRVFFDPVETYVWALAVDRANRLWVGAGNPAVIYRVEADGSASAVYRPPAAHVVSLAFDMDGRLLAGTDSPGRLYRLDATNRPFVLLDSGLAELRAVTVAGDGTIVAAAVGRTGGTSSSSESKPVSASVRAATTSAAAAATTEESSGQTTRVFRIAADGTWDVLWESEDLAYDVTTDEQGHVLVATGPEGRLYRLGPDRAVSLLSGVDAAQITRFAARRDRVGGAAFATANPGRVFSVGTDTQSPATYLSPVRDTGTIATWGLIRWEATGTVTLSTRSGNTTRPDDTWSDWSTPYAQPAGQGITSPAARFIQWRAVLDATGGAPSLSAVTVAYLPRNSRPSVTELTVHPPGIVFQRPFANEEGAIAGLDDLTALSRRPPGDPGGPTPAPGRRMFQRGLQTFAWKAEDTDGDRLTYTLRYRKDGEPTWRELRSGLLDTIFVWDTTTVPDGRYVVRLEASDELSNATGQSLSGQRESQAVTIDNTPPVVTVASNIEGGATRLTVDVLDLQSAIQKLEYSIAGGPWQLAHPDDGLADALVERFTIQLPAGEDPQQVVVRATDLLHNVTSAPAAR